MSLFNVFNISGSALSAQSVRLNTISSNLANADMVSGNPDDVYRARYPVFSSAMEMAAMGQDATGVRVSDIVESTLEARKEYAPGNPMADEDGYIYRPNIDSVQEMANMISASRSYQSSVEAMNTTKQLILRTINLGR
ncbi:MAG: flagellar basal body rod protein FlgC [Porticoccaceae bacterium]|nr:flagellar basal body rod protein FlgC [Pseudomonadales bacterium]MCP5173007.1 flagellar basal body rod protein FlgC [Pseudomonadales bacterium]MCP5302480.1 flagellar basal body rod protein FlgC [Pseudomonadales bacterium]